MRIRRTRSLSKIRILINMADSVDEISSWTLSGYQEITVTREQLIGAVYFCEVLKIRIFEDSRC